MQDAARTSGRSLMQSVGAVAGKGGRQSSVAAAFADLDNDGKVDVVVSLLLDVFLAIPAVILALALVTILRTQPGTNGGNATYPSINANNGAKAGGKITLLSL